ncbi:MAG: hypothetical protein ABIC82_03320 [bacterium]
MKGEREDVMLSFLIWVLVWTLVFGVSGFGIVLLVIFWSDKDILFTKVKEGYGKIVISPSGAFLRAIVQWDGYHLDNNGDIVPNSSPSSPPPPPPPTPSTPSWLKGIHWLGIPRLVKVFKYDFRWRTLEQNGDDGTKEIVDHVKENENGLDHFTVQEFVYYNELKAAEDTEKLALDFGLLFTMQIVNPYKAFFGIHKWLEVVMNRLLANFRLFVGNHSWDALQGTNAQSLLVADFHTNAKIGTGNSAENLFVHLEDHYGVRVKATEITSIALAGVNIQRVTEASTKGWEAKQEAKRIKTIADAIAYQIKKETAAVSKYGARGELVRRLQTLEKVSEGKATTIMLPSDLGSAVAGQQVTVAQLQQIISQLQQQP